MPRLWGSASSKERHTTSLCADLVLAGDTECTAVLETPIRPKILDTTTDLEDGRSSSASPKLTAQILEDGRPVNKLASRSEFGTNHFPTGPHIIAQAKSKRQEFDPAHSDLSRVGSAAPARPVSVPTSRPAVSRQPGHKEVSMSPMLRTLVEAKGLTRHGWYDDNNLLPRTPRSGGIKLGLKISPGTLLPPSPTSPRVSDMGRRPSSTPSTPASRRESVCNERGSGGCSPGTEKGEPPSTHLTSSIMKRDYSSYGAADSASAGYKAKYTDVNKGKSFEDTKMNLFGRVELQSMPESSTCGAQSDEDCDENSEAVKASCLSIAGSTGLFCLGKSHTF